MYLKAAVFILVTLLIISVGINFFLFRKQNFSVSFDNPQQPEKISPSPTQTSSISQTLSPTISVSAARKEFIGKSFNVPIGSPEGGTRKLKYTLYDYEITDSIVVGGKTATAVTGRAFLIVNIQIENPLENAIEINTKDYLRLSVNNSQNWVAADIHNDPVAIQPISTKLTRIGFPINESDSQFSLQFGEISGSKEVIRLN